MCAAPTEFNTDPRPCQAQRHSPWPSQRAVLLDRRLQTRDFGCGESGLASTSPKTLLSVGNAWDFLKKVEERAKGLSCTKKECRPLWQITSSLPASRAQNQTSSPSGTSRLHTAQPHSPSSRARPRRHATTPSPRSTNPSSRSPRPQTQRSPCPPNPRPGPRPPARPSTVRRRPRRATRARPSPQ